MRKEIAFLNSPFPYFIAAAMISIMLTGCSSDNMRVKQPIFGHDGSGHQRVSSYQNGGQANAWAVANKYDYSGRNYASSQNSFSSYPQSQPAVNGYGNNYNAYMGNEVTGSINAQQLAPIQSSNQNNINQTMPQYNSNDINLVKPVARPGNNGQSSWQIGAQPSQNSVPATSSGSVQVRDGDTLMSISRRYNVQPADLLRVNSLTSATQISSGQMLMLPTQNWNNLTEQPAAKTINVAPAVQNIGGPQGYRPPNIQYQPAKRSSLNHAKLVQLAMNGALMNDASPVGFLGSVAPRPTYRPQIAENTKNIVVAQNVASYAIHVAQNGETYPLLARKYGLSPSVISHANGATPSGVIEAGQKIVVPGLNDQQLQMLRAANSQSQQSVASVSRPANDNEMTTGSVPTVQKSANGNPVAINNNNKLASIVPIPTNKPIAQKSSVSSVAQSKSNDAMTTGSIPSYQPTEKTPSSVPQSAATSLKFRWPVKGRVVSAFGSKTDAGQNDGVNIAVPEGTPVKSAEDGIVAYTGNELKGYGNLILISHANGAVTAYAHNSEILVKKGDKVIRGQTISKAGQTGSVNQPQVHFEIRQGSKPVDPMIYLSNT